MGSWVDLDDGAGRAWLARPSDGEGPGVLLLHAWWGLNQTILDVADRLAAEGFAETFAVVRAGAERVVRDRGEIGRGIGVVGFSFGAAYALELVADPPPD